MTDLAITLTLDELDVLTDVLVGEATLADARGTDAFHAAVTKLIAAFNRGMEAASISADLDREEAYFRANQDGP